MITCGQIDIMILKSSNVKTKEEKKAFYAFCVNCGNVAVQSGYRADECRKIFHALYIKK